MARGSRRINGGLRNKQADNDETLQPQEELDQNEDTTPKPLKKDPKKMNQTRPSPQEEFDEENDGCTPLGNQSIELWMIGVNTFEFIFSRDNLVTTVVSTSKGYFLIEADNEWRSSFYLKAYHQCGLSKEQIYEKCKRVTKIKVDKKFTNNNRMQQLPSWDMDAENKANDKIQC
uniref:Uncharacterized protein n=1 Tax=Acrobeloides nanus TaxID=290746 RepID=A0A914D7T8_9BILA